MFLKGKPLWVQLLCGVGIFALTSVIMYAMVQLDSVEPEHRVHNFDIAFSMLVGGATALTAVLPRVKVSAKAKIRWIMAKYLLAAGITVAIVIIGLITLRRSPLPWMDAIMGIAFAITFICWLIDEATKEIRQIKMLGGTAQSSRADKALVVPRRKVRLKGSGPLRPAIYPRRDGYKVVAYGGRQPHNRRLRRR